MICSDKISKRVRISKPTLPWTGFWTVILADYIGSCVCLYRILYVAKSLPVCDCTSPLGLMKWASREMLHSKHCSCKGHLWLRNKTLRTHWYQVGLPVLLSASSAAWLQGQFFRSQAFCSVFVWVYGWLFHAHASVINIYCSSLDTLCQGWAKLLQACV